MKNDCSTQQGRHSNVPVPRIAHGFLIVLLTVHHFSPAQISAQDALNTQNALKTVDSFRLFDKDGFSFDFSTTGAEGFSLMRVSVRPKDDAALVRYLEPAKKRRRLVLIREDSFWLLDTNMKSPLRISPRQLLFGQASAGDIARIGFGTTYDVVELRPSASGLLIALKAKKAAGATYDLVDLYTDKNYRPVEAACRGRNGNLIKTIKYEKYEIIGGKELLTGFSITDELSGEVEHVMLSNFDRAIPPTSAFTVQGLRFQK
jgi:hypothetical protein